MIPAYINFVLLLVISTVHLYWALGGQWGLQVAVPEQNSKRVIKPGRLLTLLVAALFGSMALYYLYKIGLLPVALPFVPAWLDQYGLWLLAGIFQLRAIGDFRYVGFTKKVYATRFADLDTQFYSPLCLVLSLNTVWLIWSLADS